jgi:hypothetical protein
MEASAVTPLVGPIRGYRWWGVQGDGWLFSAWFREGRWSAAANQAECLGRGRWRRCQWARRHPHGVPGWDCGCGFHALSSPPSADEDATAVWPWQTEAGRSGDEDLVFGVVQGWGRVTVGTRGWRAQYARPLALWVRPDSPLAGDPRMQSLARRYPVPILGDLGVLISEWGPDARAEELVRLAEGASC